MPQLSSSLKCSNCGAELDGAEMLEDDEAHPGDGDISVCLYCASVAVYEDKVTRLRLITDAEIAAMPSEERAYIQQVRAAIWKGEITQRHF